MTAQGAPSLVVVGAGVMGAWTALLAARAGWRTMLVDAYGAGHSRSTSADETRLTRAGHGDEAYYTRSSRRSLQAWRDLESEAGERLFLPTGLLWLARRDDGFETASEATLRAEGVPVERLEAAHVTRQWPQISTEGISFAVHEPEAGVLLARRSLLAVVRTFTSAGGRFEIGSIQPGRAVSGRLADVVARDGSRLEADAFVFACGPWLPRLFPDVLGRLIRVTKQDVLFIGTPGGDGRFAAEWMPCWVDYEAAFYGFPTIDGRGVKVAPDRYGPVFEPSSGDRMVDPETVRLARRYLARRMPDLAAEPIVETRVCQYDTTPDTHFVLDRHPAWDNVWLVGGGSGHAFKHGPVIGETVVRRLAGEEPIGDEARFTIGQPREARPGLRTGGDSIAGLWDEY